MDDHEFEQVPRGVVHEAEPYPKNFTFFGKEVQLVGPGIFVFVFDCKVQVAKTVLSGLLMSWFDVLIHALMHKRNILINISTFS